MKNVGGHVRRSDNLPSELQALYFMISNFLCFQKSKVLLPLKDSLNPPMHTLPFCLLRECTSLHRAPLIPWSDRTSSYPAPGPSWILKEIVGREGKGDIGKGIWGNPPKNYWKCLVRRKGKLGHISPISYSLFQVKYLF